MYASIVLPLTPTGSAVLLFLAGAGEMGPPEAILAPRLVAGMLPPRSTKKRQTLRVERVLVDFGTALRRAFTLEQATHGVHGPDSSMPSCFALSRVIHSLRWPSSRCISITPRDSNALEDKALLAVLLQRRPSPRTSQIPRNGRYI